MDTKLRPTSSATALANKVFPHPGGPHTSIPLGGTSKPVAANSST